MAHKSFTSDLSIPVSGATTRLLLDAESPVPFLKRFKPPWDAYIRNENMDIRSPDFKSEIWIPVKKQM